MEDQKKELSIKTVPVEIRVLTVDGKRMTKSVFDQIIPARYPALIEYKDNRWVLLVSALGWVRGSQNHHLLYHKEGVLFKSTWERCFDSIGKLIVSELDIGDKPASVIDDIMDPIRSDIMDELFDNHMQVFISI